MTDRVWRRSDDWVGSPVEDSYVMVNIDSGTYVALNPTARAIWEALETPRTQEEVEASLLRAFDVAPETCTRSVTRTLQEMQVQQLASAS
ncbi:PqqD family protein [Sphingomonas koreensis]